MTVPNGGQETIQADPGKATEDTTKTGTLPGQTDVQKPSGQQNSEEVVYSPEQQKHIDKLLAKAREEGRETGSKATKEDLEARQAKEKADADEAALKEQKKFEELANQRQTKIGELEAKVTELEGKLTETSKVGETHKAALTKFLDEQRKDLPDHIKTLLDKLDVAEQLEYIAANAETIRKPATQLGRSPLPGNQQKPGQAGKKPDEQPAQRKSHFWW